MGLVYANVELLNATDVDMAARHQIGEDEIRHLEISCMVDTGAVMLIINEEIRAARCVLVGHPRTRETLGMREPVDSAD